MVTAGQISTDGGSLTFETSEGVVDLLISNRVEAMGMDIMLLKVPSGFSLNENIFGANGETVIWQICPIQHVYEDSPYVSIQSDGEHLFARNWDGDRVEINPLDGNVISVSEGR